MRHQAPPMPSEGGCWAEEGEGRGDPGHSDLVGAVIHELAAEFVAQKRNSLRVAHTQGNPLSIVSREIFFIAPLRSTKPHEAQD